MMLEKNWDNIKKRVIVPLWRGKFKSMYESAKLDYDDFESLAGLELSKAMADFDSNKSNIYTYATNVITKKAMTELRNCTQRDKRRVLHAAESIDSLDTSVAIFEADETKDVLSEKMNRYLERLSKLQKRVLFALSEGYSNDEIRMKLGISIKEFAEACTALRSYRNTSLLY